MAFLVSCNNMERLDTTNLKEQVEAHKIKRIAESDVLLFLNKKGTEIAKKLKCTDSLEIHKGYQLNPINPLTFKTKFEKEKQILEALQFASEDAANFQAIPQRLTETDYAFYFVSLCGEDNTPIIFRALFKKSELIRMMYN
jgi:hypothetical protein